MRKSVAVNKNTKQETPISEIIIIFDFSVGTYHIPTSERPVPTASIERNTYI